MLWLIGMSVLLVVVIGVGSGRGGRVQKDPQRAFTIQQRTAIFARARNQCEHFNVIGRRCTNAPTHADHIYPHSKGGATALANGQAMCARCNLTKSAHLPGQIYLNRLERRRRSYFPPGMPVDIVWRVGGQ
jgi:5-methylcytosine-specific restriction endonuclease McrA